MATRITCRDTWLDAKEVIEGTGVIVPSSEDPKASYTGSKEEIRILCGSVSLLLGGSEYAMNNTPQNRAFALASTGLVAAPLWVGFGLLIIFGSSVDWNAVPPPPPLKALLTEQKAVTLFAALFFSGAFIGLSLQTLAEWATILRFHFAVLLLPVACGTSLGVLQAALVGFWQNLGLLPADMPLRPLAARLLLGAVCGFFASAIIMWLAANIRKILRRLGLPI